MADPIQTRSFPAGRASIPLIQQFVSKRLVSLGVSPKTATATELVVEELVTNTIKYGFTDLSQGKIEVSLEFRNQQMILVINDNGRAFNPLEQKDPDLDSDLEARQVGGLGIFFVKQLAQDIHYTRSRGINSLRVTL